MNWWIERADDAARVSDLHYTDPGGVLSQWRQVKLLRGLLRHPSTMVRVPACRELLLLGAGGKMSAGKRYWIRKSRIFQTVGSLPLRSFGVEMLHELGQCPLQRAFTKEDQP